VAGFAHLSELPERISVRVSVGTTDAQELTFSIATGSRQQARGWDSGLLRTGLPFQLAALIWFQPPTCCLLAGAIL